MNIYDYVLSTKEVIMKVHISEDYDTGEGEFTFTEDIRGYKKDDPYIIDIDDNKLARWNKILAEKKRIDKKYRAIQSMLYDIKVFIDNELLGFVCPGCKQILVLDRETIKWAFFHCYYCDCLIGEKKGKYYVHSGEGVASIDKRCFWTEEKRIKDDAEKKQRLIDRERKVKKSGILKIINK